MVVSRPETMQRRSKRGAPEPLVQAAELENGKRTKVHAQRKFAQGSALSSPALTPVKDKGKSNGSLLNAEPEIIHAKRPKTHDFLTFLCLRGTALLPARLDLFAVSDAQADDDFGGCGTASKSAPRTATRPEKSQEQQGTKRSDVPLQNGLPRRKPAVATPTSAVQALKKKYQDQRLSKQTRSRVLNKLAQKVKDKNMARTRSAGQGEPQPGSVTRAGKSVNAQVEHRRSTRSCGAAPSPAPTIAKKRNGLRSGGRVNAARQLVLSKARQAKARRAAEKAGNCDASSDDEPLVAKSKVGSNAKQVAMKRLRAAKASVSKSPARMQTRSARGDASISPPRMRKNVAPSSATKPQARLSRKTKEAAAVYMELLGKKWMSPDEDEDEDSMSLYSFPEIRKAPGEKKCAAKPTSRRAPPATESDDEPLGRKVTPRRAGEEKKKAKKKQKACSSLSSIAKRTRLHSEKMKLIKESKKVSVSKLLQQQKKKYLGTRKSKEACIQELVQSTLQRLDKAEKEAMKKEREKVKVDPKALDPVLLDKKLRHLASAVTEEKVATHKDSPQKTAKKVDKSPQKSDKIVVKEVKATPKVEKLAQKAAKQPQKDEKTPQKVEKLPRNEETAPQAEVTPPPKLLEKSAQKEEPKPPRAEVKPKGKPVDLKKPMVFAAKKTASILPVSAKKLANLGRRTSPCPPAHDKPDSHCTKCGRADEATVKTPVPPPPLILTSPVLQSPADVGKLMMLNHPTQRDLVLLTPQNPAAGPSKFIVCRKEELAVLQSSAGTSGAGLQLMMVPTSRAQDKASDVKPSTSVGPPAQLGAGLQLMMVPTSRAQDKASDVKPLTSAGPPTQLGAGLQLMMVPTPRVQDKASDVKPSTSAGPSTQLGAGLQLMMVPTSRAQDKASDVKPLTSAGPPAQLRNYRFNAGKIAVQSQVVETASVASRSPEEKKSIFQRKHDKNKTRSTAFSPDNESSVYAFQSEPEETPSGIPFRRKTLAADKQAPPACSRSSTSIAVQVNLDESAADTEAEPAAATPELEPAVDSQRSSFECSTQTDEGDHLFYIPLEREPRQLIQGVEVKLGTEGPNQRVVMRAKLVSKSSERFNTAGMVRSSQHPATMLGKAPLVGTVQPTARSAAAVPAKLKPLSAPAKSGTKQAKPTPPVSEETPPPAVTPPKPQKSGQGVKQKARPQKVCAKRSSVDSSSGKRPAVQRQTSTSKPPRLAEPVPTPASFPSPSDKACVMEAPTFYPTEKEFQDPMEYFERIRPEAEQFGLCRIVPPSSFKPECKVSDDMRFTAYNHYVHKMLNRWGPNVKALTALKKFLKSQNVDYTHPPWIGGMEVDLPRFHQTVQQLGGLMEVIQKKSWNKVADLMKIPKSAQDRVTKLDDIYCKFLLAYSTLAPEERQALCDEVEEEWSRKQGPGDAESEDHFDDSEECITKGRNMPLNAFYRIGRNTMSMWFRSPEPTASEVEAEYWHIAQEGSSHVCVHAGSIDSGGGGYGFPCNKNSPCAKHPWNLKVLTNNSGTVLRSMGAVMGVTVPTLHVGMLFSTCCWYRDPHGLPWIEYLHTGASKIWYGIPDSQSGRLRSTLSKVVPKFCRDQTVWLPSDTAMVPPSVLTAHDVSLCRTVQQPGQFILVFPRAFTSSVCTGYLVSESVYFAPPSWLDTAEQVFKELKESCEPTMFSLERLLFSIAQDNRCSVQVLRHVQPQLRRFVDREQRLREALKGLGLKSWERLPLAESAQRGRKARVEDDSDYECEVCRENLYLSLVTNSHEEGVYCLPHALSLLTRKKHHLKFCKLLYTYDMDELEELLHKLDDKIAAKVAKKCHNKHSATKCAT